MKTYRIGILGCRGRGTAAARAYHAHPRTEIVGLCDLVEERLDTLGEEVNVTARFTDLDEMIRQTQPDIVAIPTGTEFHYDLCMRVLEHGVNIEVEKPMCVDLVQADAVIAKAKAKGVQVAVHHQGRVGAPMQSLARAFEAGKIGELRYMYGSGKGYYGGYGLMNIGTHMLNNMLHFGKRCQSIVAHLTTGGKPIMATDVVPSPSGMGTIAGEYITATLQYEGNVTGTLLQHRFHEMDTNGYTMGAFTALKEDSSGDSVARGCYRHRIMSLMAHMTSGNHWISSILITTTRKVARRKRITGLWRIMLTL